ncbi:MAG: conjugal transfer protein TraF [Gemmatimonadota bacterium]
MMRAITLRTLLPLGLLLLPATAAAQIGNPAPQALGMGGNYTALARGLAAPAWNPAGLGMPDNPGASFALLPLHFNAGLSPIALSDLAEYDGELIPAEQREAWLAEIRENGSETGAFGTDVTLAALSVGRVALSASSSVRGRVDMAPDVAEVFFFGNAGLTGEPGTYTLAGSSLDVSGTTTLAASFALPLSLALGPLPDQHFALGATLKYTVGNFLVLGRESGSSISSDPLEVNVAFPMVHTPFSTDAETDLFGNVLNNGSGIGLDLGAAWKGGPLSAGVAIRNIVNTFEWDLEGLLYREGTAVWNADTSATTFEELHIDRAPTELLDRIDELYTFSPVLSAGVAARLLPFLLLTGDVRHALDDNLDIGVQNHLGVGAELDIVPFLPLRAGLAAVSGGYQLSGGAGLRLGPVQLSAAAAMRQTDLGDDSMAALALTFGLR